jgi:predicted ATPase with chaperone activity
VAERAIAATVDMLESKRVEESDGRFARQVARIAKAVAALKGENAVGEEHLHQALRFTTAARVGILATRSLTVEALTAVDELFK